MKLIENDDSLVVSCDCGESQTYHHRDLAASAIGVHWDTLARRHRHSSLKKAERIGVVVGRRLYFSVEDLKRLGFDPNIAVLEGAK
jgi:hypothetical protein